MKNILVTGGAGYIGSHTVVELVNAGYNPVILDNFSNSEPSVIKRISDIVGQPITSYEGSYQNKVLLKKILKDELIDGLVHFAAFKAVGESVAKPLAYYENNVSGFITLLQLLKQVGVEAVVFSSSATVYGEADRLPITETAPLKPASSPYGSTKQMCETILKDSVMAGDSYKAMALRYFNPIGAHPSGKIGELPIGVPNNLIPFITQAAAGLRPMLTVFGDTYPTSDGSCIRDYIHVVDLARAHIAALQHLAGAKSRYYDVCNIGTGKGHSVLEVLELFTKATGQKIPYTIGPPREGDVAVCYASADKAKRLLKWQAKLSLSQALKDAWNWQQQLAKN